MAFIVKKKINGNEYYYLNENKRVEGKVKTKTIAYLGKIKKDAQNKAKNIIKEMDEEKKEIKISLKKPRQLTKENISIDELARFCKEKGFVYRSSDIYGGLAGFWDFGPLGIELFNNIKKDWWNFFVHQKDNVIGMEASIISHPRTWKASGHIENFNDISVKCKKCGRSGKLDENELGKVNCPDCGGEFISQGKINLMFETKVGVSDSETVYLRGETAQGMFMDFKLINQTSRVKLPFGIAQIGRCFRNEIAPRDFLFRSREFHIGEFEFFINPEEKKCILLDKEHLEVSFKFLSEEEQKKDFEELKLIKIKDLIKKNKIGEWHAYWLAEQILWFKKIGLEEIKIREHTKEELSHYSSATFDIDYEYPFGSKEVAGNANRGQYDLKQHIKESKEKMEIFDEEYGKKVIPRVIEPTFGMERVFLAILTKAYCVDDKNNIILKLPFRLAPIKVSVFPIIKRKEFEEIAKDIVKDLRKEWNVSYDNSGSIGKRYSRNDEIGTPFCITIDEDSSKNNNITIRERDTTKQIKVKISKVKETLRKLISNEIEFEKIGKLIITRKK